MWNGRLSIGVVIMCVCLYWSTVQAQTRSEFIAALIIDYDNRIPPNFEKILLSTANLTDNPWVTTSERMCSPSSLSNWVYRNGNAFIFGHTAPSTCLCTHPDNYTEVQVSLFINSISISETAMDFTMNTFIQQEWFDSRLQFFGLIDSPYLELDAKLINYVWVPDLYFTNEKKASFHDVTVPNKMMHLYADGRVIYRQRISVTASCPMQLHKYPFDSQVCSLYIQSFAYTLARLRFKWRALHPVKTNTNLELPQFRLTKHSVTDCTETGGTSIEELHNFTCIQMDIYLTRNLGFYMIQLYIPTILIVQLSWVSFWLSIDAVPARISLGILTVLTITTQKTNAVASVPPVSYVKALDVWMAMCLMFVFVALLEYPLVYVLENNDKQMRQRNARRPTHDDAIAQGEHQSKMNTIKDEIPCQNRRSTGRYIDDISKIIFPLTFLTFILVYWVYYSM